jgi:hypothetical protein
MSASNVYGGVNRPKTAAFVSVGLTRPPTGVTKINNPNFKTNQTANMPFRGFSAVLPNNGKVKRYEDVISRLKRMLDIEKKSLRMVKTMCSKEIEVRNILEKVLRQCVDDVKSEIARKRSENKSIYCKHSLLVNMNLDSKGRRGDEDRNLT